MRRKREKPATVHERILGIWASYQGTTGDAVRWLLARCERLENEKRRLNAELDAAARELAAERVRRITNE